MKRVAILFSVTALFLAAFVLIPDRSQAGEFNVGSVLEDFKLTDTNGKEHSFADVKGAKGSVIVFLSAQCPVVKIYNARVNKIADDYKAKGINFIGINSNSTESLEWVKSHAAENYKFPMLIDKGNVLADELAASVTPEVYLFDAKGKLVYKGAVDNDRSGENVTSNYLTDALDAMLAGKAVAKTSTNAVGCTIKRGEAKATNATIKVKKM
jgi:peroxiredoxin